MTQNRNINFAILGFGGSGQAHLFRLSAIDGIKVIKVFDTNPKTLKKAAKEYKNIHFTDNFLDIFDGSVNAVAICTPDYSHFQYASETVSNGLHTLVEKPMFVSRRECKHMKQILDASNAIFGVHHQMRFLDLFCIAREYVINGRLGEIVSIEADYIHDMRVRATYYDDWRMKNHYQNIVLGGLSHVIDLICWIINEDVTNIFAYSGHKGWIEYPDMDTVIALLKFSSGTIGKVAKTIASSGPQRNTLAIYGTKGQIHNNIYRDENGRISCLSVPGNLSFLKSLVLKPVLKQMTKLNAFREYPFSIYEHNNSCVKLLNAFVKSIQCGLPFPIGFSEGYKTIDICLSCIESYQTGKNVRLK